jgi:hypothetical protein
VELGAWEIRRLRQAPAFSIFPWTSPEACHEHASTIARLKRDPLALARFYQSLLDSGTVESRAALARYLGVSRSRVTQVLQRLEGAPKSFPREHAEGMNGESRKEGDNAAN